MIKTYYVLILISTVLLGVFFCFQKKYQISEGISWSSSLRFHVYSGILGFIILLAINKFQIEFSLYSYLMAFILAVLISIYTILGFNILHKGNMSLYTLFLMSGGMLLPYIYGLIFLNEFKTSFSLLRILGTILILFAIIITNVSTKANKKTPILLCIAVFILNGGVSIISKLHQINNVYNTISSTQFAMLTNLFKSIICIPFLMYFSKKEKITIPRKKWIKVILPLTLFAAAANSISYVLQLVGAANVPASVLYPFISGGAIIFTALAGFIVFKEKLKLKQILSILLVFTGTLLFL